MRHKQAVRAFHIDTIQNKPVGLAEGLSCRLNLIYGEDRGTVIINSGCFLELSLKIAMESATMEQSRKKQVIEMNAGIIAGQMLVL